MQTTKHAEIDSAIAQVATGLTQLRSLMQDPSDLSFELLHPHFEHLERALGNKSAIDAAFAFIAERDDAGRRVGSSKAKDYLTTRLGLTDAEAAARLGTVVERPEDADLALRVRDAGWRPVAVFASATVVNVVVALGLAAVLFADFDLG